MAVGQVNENKRRPESLRCRIGQERIEPKLKSESHQIWCMLVGVQQKEVDEHD